MQEEKKAEKEKKTEDVIEISKEKKEKIKSFLQDKSNLILVGILILAFAIRLYYFILTKNQPLWWDEAAYGSIARTLIDSSFRVNAVLDREFIIRPLFLPLLWALFMKFGLSEAVARFFLIFIPSFLSVLFIYLITKELSNKRMALISTFLFSVSWIHLFYSMRLLTETPSLFLSLVSIYFFIRAYKQDFKIKPILISILFLSFSIMMRYPFGLIGFAYILFIIFTKRFNVLKKSSFWLGSIIGLIPLFLFFIYNTVKTGFFFPALHDYSSTVNQAAPFAFYALKFILHYFQKVFYVFFLIGLFICLAELFLGFGTIKKNKKSESHLLIMIIMIVSLAFFIFIIRGAEDRYLFVSLISFIYFASISLDYLYNLIKKYIKIIAIAFLLFVLIFGAYQQFKFGDAMIKDKKESYLWTKDSFLWLKENSNPQDTVMTTFGDLYSIYYAERNTVPFPANETEFENQLSKTKPTFLMIDSFNSPPQYITQYVQQHPDLFKLEKIISFKEQQAVFIFRLQ